MDGMQGIASGVAPRRASNVPPKPVRIHPMLAEARRNLRLARRLGIRLEYQLRRVEAIEAKLAAEALAAGVEGVVGPGSLPLPDGWLVTFATYSDVTKGLLHENRMWLTMQHGRNAGNQLDAGAESEELVDAVSLLTEDELRQALERRAAKSGGG